MQNNKDNLTYVTTVYDESLKSPVKEIDGLKNFLESTDCEKYYDRELFITCYKITRLKLIEGFRQLDDTNYRLYLLNDSIRVLRANMAEVIMNLPEMK